MRLKLKDMEQKPIYIPQDFETCTHVFLRNDAVLKPLQQPYSGPYVVIKRNDKTFTIKINNSEKVVSADRVKPAKILTNNDVESSGNINNFTCFCKNSSILED